MYEEKFLQLPKKFRIHAEKVLHIWKSSGFSHFAQLLFRWFLLYKLVGKMGIKVPHTKIVPQIINGQTAEHNWTALGSLLPAILGTATNSSTRGTIEIAIGRHIAGQKNGTPYLRTDRQ